MTCGLNGGWFFTLLVVVMAVPIQAEPPSEVARDAVGILVDNQDRCLELSYGRLGILEEDYTSDEQTEELDHYLNAQNESNVRVARNALGIARRLAREVGRGEGNVSRSLDDMLGSQEELCEWATSAHSWNDAAIYSRQIREQGDQFAEAQAALPTDLQLTSSQRREVVQKYRDQLYSGRDDVSVAGTSGSESDPGVGSLDGPISDGEYQRKKKAYDEWLAEQERREAETVRRQAERRTAMQERLKQQPREMPKLELRVPEESEEAVIDPEEVVAWHGEYSTRIAPFKRSLSGFLKARSPTRTLIMFNACLDLARAAQAILDDPKALESPDPRAGKSLRRAVTFFKQASDACVNNRLKASRNAVTQGERALGEAAKALKPYELGL